MNTYRRAMLALAVFAVALVPSMAVAAAPGNDNFSAAMEIPPAGGAATSSNVDATAEVGEPDHANSTFGALHSVWFAWTAPADGPTTLDTCGSGFNTRLAVYTGGTVDALTEVASNDNASSSSCGQPLFAALTFTATAGTTYRIAVDTMGGVPDDFSGPPQGEVKIALDGPDAPADPEPDRTNPGSVAAEQPFSFEMPRFKPNCKQVKGDEDCPRKNTHLTFKTLRKVRSAVRQLQSQGADLILREVPKPSTNADGDILEFLQKEAVGGEILDQNLSVGKTVTTTAANPQVIKVGYFEPAEDERIRKDILKALEKSKPGGGKPKSKCEFIASNATPDQIETKMAELLGAGYLTQERAGEILKKFGCDYEVSKYIDAPGATIDFVKDVTGINRERDLIELEVALPVQQDFLLVLREDPSIAGMKTLGIGVDGALTASDSQFNLVTVQVIERTTGRLVEGAEVSFYDLDGKPITQRTNGNGEVNLAPKLPKADSYAIKVSVRGSNGATMNGYREVVVKNRKREPFTTMSGRVLGYVKANGEYRGTQEDLDRALSLPVVPGNLGTGRTAAPSSAPVIQQGQAIASTATGLVVGDHNVVSIPDNSNFAVGAAPGLVTLGGGLAGSYAGRAAHNVPRRAFPNPFASIGNFVNGIVTGLKRVFEQGSKAPGTAAQVISGAEQQAIATAADRFAANGATVPPPGLISDKGLGVISTGGGNVISTGGLNVIATGGLNLIGQAGGNVISTGGGNVISTGGLNLIGQAGGNVIATGGLNLIGQAGGNVMPVYGGRIISDNGAS